MVWCSPGTTEGGGNHQLSVLKFHEGMVPTGHHGGRRQSSVISAKVFMMVWCSQGTTEGASNWPLSVLGFHDGMVLTGHHEERRQSSVISARVSSWYGAHRAPQRAAAIISYQCSSFMMVWCSQGTTQVAGNHQLSVLEFHDGMVLTRDHRGRQQSPIISARVS